MDSFISLGVFFNFPYLQNLLFINSFTCFHSSFPKYLRLRPRTLAFQSKLLTYKKKFTKTARFGTNLWIQFAIFSATDSQIKFVKFLKKKKKIVEFYEH